MAYIYIADHCIFFTSGFWYVPVCSSRQLPLPRGTLRRTGRPLGSVALKLREAHGLGELSEPGGTDLVTSLVDHSLLLALRFPANPAPAILRGAVNSVPLFFTEKCKDDSESDGKGIGQCVRNKPKTLAKANLSRTEVTLWIPHAQIQMMEIERKHLNKWINIQLFEIQSGCGFVVHWILQQVV